MLTTIYSTRFTSWLYPRRYFFGAGFFGVVKSLRRLLFQSAGFGV